MGQSASKEKFRESVQALIHVDVSADDAEFWDELWKIPASAEEVFELLPSSSVRTLRDTHFDNLATLFTQAVAQLCQIVETPYNIYFDQALNCVRVLTRILPFILEKGTYMRFPFFSFVPHWYVVLNPVCFPSREHSL
jgi:High-temperature-induced dauer-formation protein